MSKAKDDGLDPILVYRKTLSRQKEIIKNNCYANELEKKYNKFKVKHRDPVRVKKETRNFNFWPIHSIVFSQVLRNKLNQVLHNRTPKAVSKPVTRLGNRVNRSFNSTKRQNGFLYDDGGFTKVVGVNKTINIFN